MSQFTAVAQKPRRRGLPWWAWVLIGVGAVVVIAVPTTVLLGMAAYVNHSIAETSPDQAFLEGRPQRPDADAPLPCPDQCFALTDANQLAVSATDVAPLSIEKELHGVGAFDPSTVAEATGPRSEQWLALGGDEECSFIPSNAPYMMAGPDSTSTDPISWIQTWETGDEMADLAARAFPTTEAASAFMAGLHQGVLDCPWQNLSSLGQNDQRATLVQITAQAAIDVPQEIAAVGWVREGTPGARWRSYVWDLQRGNLVVQVRVITDGRIHEQEVATFAELVAARFGALPVGTP